MSAPPVFGEGDELWGLGSTVRVHWWAPECGDLPSYVKDPWAPLGVRIVERSAKGTVSALTAGGPEGWLVEVYLGPLLELSPPPGWPRTFNPSQVRRA